MSDIYLLIEGKQEGPYAEDLVRQSLAEALIPADLPAWHDGLADWVTVESLVGSSMSLPIVSPIQTQSDREVPGWEPPPLPALEWQPPPPPALAGSSPPARRASISNACTRIVSHQKVLLVSLLILGIVVGAGVYILHSRNAGQKWTNSLGMKFVSAGTPGVLFCIWDVRVKDFKAFVDDTGYDATAGMYSVGTDGWEQKGDTWKSPGFTQTDNCPVVGVSWDDAHAFCDWLTKKEQAEGKLTSSQVYRLPTDAEWSTAAGDGKYPWGNQWPPPSGAGNYAGEEINGEHPSWPSISGYNDGYLETSPVGSFAANQYGLYDMGGNVWQWCEDWYRTSMNSDEIRQHTPLLDDDGGGKEYKVLRGASWIAADPDGLSSSIRSNFRSAIRGDQYGFRLVLATSDAIPTKDNQEGISTNYGNFSKDLIVERLQAIGFDVSAPPETDSADNDQSSLKITFNSVDVILFFNEKTKTLLQATVSVNLTPSDRDTDPDAFNKILSTYGNTVSAVTLDMLSKDEFTEMYLWHQQGLAMGEGDPKILEAHRSKTCGRLSVDSDWGIVTTGSKPVVCEKLVFTKPPSISPPAPPQASDAGPAPP